MLVRLQPSDITGMWDVLKPSIADALPEVLKDDQTVLGNIMRELLNGKMQAWEYSSNDEIIGTVTTKPIFDSASNTRNLLIYSIRGFKRLNEDQWRRSFETLISFAQSIGCYHVVGYTTLEYVKDKVVNDLGGKFEYFVSMEV